MIEHNPATGRRVLDYTNLFRLIPFFIIYLFLEIHLLPVFHKNRNILRYVAASVSLVVVVMTVWYFVIGPRIVVWYPSPINKQVAVIDTQAQNRMMELLETDSIGRDVIIDTCNVWIEQTRMKNAQQAEHPKLMYFIAVGLGVFAFISTLHFVFDWMQSENERNELAKLKAEADLKLLKYQLNPHFLMNTLNNINILIEEDAAAAQESVMLLSKMMRYMLYDVTSGRVTLSKEINFVNNYIELMKKRYIDKVAIDFTYPDEYTDVTIPPTLFINLVENAFKHGISYVEESFVRCCMEVDAKKITFRVENSIPKILNDLKTDSGVGVESLRKRLDILYPNQYVYEVKCTENQYNVKLQIPILGLLV